MKIDEQNPWSVTNIEDFLYFCCPECDVKDQSKELFLKHALDQHPNSKAYLEYYLQIKKEKEENSTQAEKFQENNHFIENYVAPECLIKEEYEVDIKEENLNSDENLNPENIIDFEEMIEDDFDDEFSTTFKNFTKKKCELCNKEFTTSPSYRRHIESVHEGVRHQCDLCEKSFTQAAALNVHLRKNHKGEKSSKLKTGPKSVEGHTKHR